MNNKKIIFVLPDLSFGGAQKTFSNIINIISKSKNNYKFYLILINNNNIVFNINNSISVINLNCTRTIFSIFKFINILIKIKPTFVISTTTHVNILCILSKLFLSKKKTKFIIRESNPTFYRTDINIFLKLISKFTYKFSDMIICLSEFVKDEVLKNVNINPNKVITIYNPIDFESILNLAEKPTQITFSKDEYNVVFVGRLSKQKNVKLLIEVIGKINLKNIKLRIIGDGDDKDSINKKIIKSQLQNKIELLNFTENPYPYIKNSDLFILPSKWEGFGHVIAESLFLGTPVICLNTKGIVNIFFKCKYFTLLKYNSIEKISDYIELFLLKFKNNKPLIDTECLQELNSKDISLKYFDAITNLK